MVVQALNASAWEAEGEELCEFQAPAWSSEPQSQDGQLYIVRLCLKTNKY